MSIRTKTFAGALVAIALSTFAALPAAAQNYEAGVHYAPLKKPVPVATGSNIEVRELFWYGCPHCYEFEPHIQKWQKNKPDNAEYVAMPAVFRQSWEFHARAFYTFEALGLGEKAHVDFFDAIHRDRKFKQADQTPEKLGEWAESLGVKKQDIIDAYSSFAVDTKVRQAKKSVFSYEVTGVPAIIVDGKYRTSGSMAGTYEELLKVIDFLVAKSAKER